MGSSTELVRQFALIAVCAMMYGCVEDVPPPPQPSAAFAGDSGSIPAAEPIGIEPASVDQTVITAIDSGPVARVRLTAGGNSEPEIVPEDIAELQSHALLIPVAGVKAGSLRSTFYEKRGADRIHHAIDIMAPRGTPVLSVDAGTLLKMHSSRAGGLTAYASDPGNRFVFLYGHLDSYYPGLREGSALKKGDTIGLVGTTGNAPPNAPHLHFAISRNDDMSKWSRGTPLDPYPLLK